MIQLFSEAEAFQAVNDPFLELSPVGEHPSQIGADKHGGKSDEAKPLPAQIAFKQRQDFQEKIPRTECGRSRAVMEQ